MAAYRVTIRYGHPRLRYAVVDIEAADLREALRRAAELVPEEAEATADLAEVRLRADPEAREYAGY